MEWAIAIFCAATMLGIGMVLGWKSLDDLTRLALMEIDARREDRERAEAGNDH